MLKQLLAILTGEQPLRAASRDFTRMLELSQSMVIEADDIFWGRRPSAEARTALDAKDVDVNQLQRHIRKDVIAHLSGPAPSDVPFALVLMSLVKDVERIGDYSKNLARIAGREEDPNDPEVAALLEISRVTVDLATHTARTFDTSNRSRATELTTAGRAATRRCEELVRMVADSTLSAGAAVRLTLGARFYKRLLSHLLAVLSSVLKPLDQLDDTKPT